MIWPVRALSDPTLSKFKREIFRFREADGGQASPLQALEASTLWIFDFWARVLTIQDAKSGTLVCQSAYAQRASKKGRLAEKEENQEPCVW